MDGRSDFLSESQSRIAKRNPNSGRTFSLATLFAIVTVFSLWMALAVTLPEVAVPGLILLSPAIVHAVASISVTGKEGRITTLSEKATRFYYSVMTVILMYVISFGTLLVLLIAVMFLVQLAAWLLNWQELGDLEGIGGVTAGLISCFAAFIVSIWLYWRWWPRKRKFR